MLIARNPPALHALARAVGLTDQTLANACRTPSGAVPSRVLINYVLRGKRTATPPLAAAIQEAIEARLGDLFMPAPSRKERQNILQHDSTSRCATRRRVAAPAATREDTP